MDTIIEFLSSIITKAYRQGKWVALFTKPLRKNGKHQNDIVFDNTDIFSIARAVYECKGIDLKQTIYDEINKALKKKGCDLLTLKDVVDAFVDELVVAIKDENKEFYEKYLVQDTHEMVKDIHRVMVPNNDLFVAPTIVEKELKENSNDGVNLTLDYYDLDDFYIEEELTKKIQNKENVFIEYYEVEEAFYRILNYLKANGYQDIKIVTNVDNWYALIESDVTGSIVIPFFSFTQLRLIPNNVNIIITDGVNYHENQTSYLKLRKRTKRNIIDHLEAIGLSNDDACRYVCETNGLFVPLQRKLLTKYFVFEDGYKIEQEDFETVLTLFLINKWCVNDNNLIESVFGIKDVEYIYKKYTRGSNPVFVITHNNSSKEVVSIAYRNAAHHEFFDRLSKKQKENFIDFAFELLELGTDRADICKGVSESMVFVYYYSDCSVQNYIKEKFSDLLSSIKKANQLAKCFGLLKSFDDIVPDLMLQLYKNLFKNNPEEFSDLLPKFGDYALYFSFQRLIQRNDYSKDTILFVADLYTYNDRVKDILSNVLCTWYNFLPSSLKDEKVELAKDLLNKNSKMWQIIYGNLPNSGNAITTNWSEPFVSDGAIENQVNMQYVYDVSFGYMDLLIDEMGTNVERIDDVLDKVLMFPDKYIDKFIGRIQNIMGSLDDSDKASLYYSFRRFIYKNRFYKHSDWAITDKRLDRIIELLDLFDFSLSEYSYNYLYKNYHDRVLLDPLPFKDEDSDKNDENLEKLREDGLIEFKKRNLNLATLIGSYGSKDYSCLGRYIARVYSNRSFNKDIFDLIIDNDKEESLNILYGYAFAVASYGFEQFKDMATYALTKEISANKLVIVIRSYRELNSEYISILKSMPEDAKRLYWYDRNIYTDKVNREELEYILDQAIKYGNKSTYLDYLSCYKHLLPLESLYLSLFAFNKCSGTLSSNDGYEIEEVLKLLYALNPSEDIKKALCDFEIDLDDYFRWDDTLFAKYCFAKYPEYYFKLCANYYKNEASEIDDYIDEKYSFGLWFKCKFCPGLINGNFDENAFNKWISSFEELMKKHGLSSFVGDVLGRVLAYSPADSDGIVPLNPIRQYIEKLKSKDLISSFTNAVINQRGVYTVTGGVGELRLSKAYKEKAEILKDKGFKECSKIYRYLSAYYHNESVYERTRAEENS